jgi:hypothetical protein
MIFKALRGLTYFGYGRPTRIFLSSEFETASGLLPQGVAWVDRVEGTSSQR